MYTRRGGSTRTARVFRSGNSQAVRLPRDFRFDVPEVEIVQRRHEVVLRAPRRTGLQVFRALVAVELPDDFPEQIPDRLAEGRGRL